MSDRVRQWRSADEAARRWLDAVDETLDATASDMGCVHTETFQAGWAGAVGRARGPHGTDFVLKAPWPPQNAGAEVFALALWGPGGTAPRLVRYQAGEVPVIVMEHVPAGALGELFVPGLIPQTASQALLSSMAEAAQSVAAAGGELVPFDVLVSQRAVIRPGRLGALAQVGVDADTAQARSLEMAASLYSTERVIHGDLHPANVLDATRGLIVIDARCSLGDPAWDVAFLLTTGTCAPLDPTACKRLSKAYRADPDRVMGWSYVLAVEFLTGLLEVSPGRRAEIDGLASIVRHHVPTARA